MGRTGAFKQHVTLHDDAAMEDILKGLSEKTGLNVVVDGVPLRPRAKVDADGSLAQVLDRVGDTFGYKWRVGPTGTALFEKTFQDPLDRPQMIPAELAQALRDMRRCLPACDSDPDMQLWPQELTEVARTFSPEQWNTLRAGKYLNYGDLAPQQRQMLQRAVATRGLGVPRGIWDRLIFVLDNLPDGHILAMDAGASERDALKKLKHEYIVCAVRRANVGSQGIALGDRTVEVAGK